MSVIKLMREKMRLSQEDVAEKIGVSRFTIINWESGKREPKLSELIKLANLFGCTIDEMANPQPTPAGESREVRVG